MVVDLFIPCFIDQVAPEIGFSMLKVLEKLGCEVNYNPQQTCCGQPGFNAGYTREAGQVAQKWLADFQSVAQSEEHYIVAPSASCVGMVRNNYESLLTAQQSLKLYYQLQKKTFEFTEFIVDVLGVNEIPDVQFPHKVTYHDACSALRECGISAAPRQLLKSIVGLELIELPQQTTCCGFGGTFSVKFQGISTAMADQKVQNVLATQAEYVVSTDYSCLMHLEAYSQKTGKFVRFMHIADVLASGW